MAHVISVRSVCVTEGETSSPLPWIKKLKGDICWEMSRRHWAGLVPYPQIFTGYRVLAGFFPGAVSMYTVPLNKRVPFLPQKMDDSASPFSLLTKREILWLVESFRCEEAPQTCHDGLLAAGRWLLGAPKVTSSPGWASPAPSARTHGASAPNCLAGPVLNFLPFISWCPSCVVGSSELDAVSYVV